MQNQNTMRGGAAVGNDSNGRKKNSQRTSMTISDAPDEFDEGCGANDDQSQDNKQFGGADDGVSGQISVAGTVAQLTISRKVLKVVFATFGVIAVIAYFGGGLMVSTGPMDDGTSSGAQSMGKSEKQQAVLSISAGVIVLTNVSPKSLLKKVTTFDFFVFFFPKNSSTD